MIPFESYNAPPSKLCNFIANAVHKKNMSIYGAFFKPHNGTTLYYS